MNGRAEAPQSDVVLSFSHGAAVLSDARRSGSGSSDSTAPNVSMRTAAAAEPGSYVPGFARGKGTQCSKHHVASNTTDAQTRDAGAQHKPSSALPRSVSGLLRRLSSKQRPTDPSGGGAPPFPDAAARDRFCIPHPTKVASPENELKDQKRMLEYRDIYTGSVYYFEHWDKYATWHRFFQIFNPVVCWKVLLAVLPAMLTTMLTTLACALYQGLRRDSWPTLQDTDLQLAYSAVSFALSLLLIFKTNTAYARFWEARSMWGATFTYTRMFMVRAQTYAYNADLPMRQLLLRWTIALPYLMRMHLEEYRVDAGNMKVLLTPEELAYLQRDGHDGKTRHHPVLACEILATAIAKLNLRSPCQADLLSVLQDYMGCCASNERIARTPIPTPYSRHTTRFIIWYVAVLPIGLWNTCGWVTLFVAPLITFLLAGVLPARVLCAAKRRRRAQSAAGIENIGVQIENPFKSGVLPVHAYCATMQHDLLSCAGEWAAGLKDGGHLVDEVLRGKPPRWQRGRSDSDDEGSAVTERASITSAGLPFPTVPEQPRREAEQAQRAGDGGSSVQGSVDRCSSRRTSTRSSELTSPSLAL